MCHLQLLLLLLLSLSFFLVVVKLVVTLLVCLLQFLNDWQSKLWCRFFCLSVYVTMYLNDHQRTAFYESLGLNTKQFNRWATTDVIARHPVVCPTS